MHETDDSILVQIDTAVLQKLAAPLVPRSMPQPARECSLSPSQADWLVAMAERFSLPDSGKAFRCCLNWAAQADQADQALDDAATGGGCDECSGCGGGVGEGGKGGSVFAPVRLMLAATDGQWAWLDSKVAKADNAAALLLSKCMQHAASDDAASIFEVIRCKTKTGLQPGGSVAAVATAATQCEGAQAALTAAAAAASAATALAAAAPTTASTAASRGKCPCVECTCGASCQCAPGTPGCDPCGAFQQQAKQAKQAKQRAAGGGCGCGD
jgi:hypothetical protein